MTRSEVIEKIGEGHLNGPFTILPAEGESDCIGYTSDNKVALIADFAWIGMGVCYDDNDIVTRTYQNIVRN